jgi:hypothetical protein
MTRWQAHFPSTQAGPKPVGQSEEHSEAEAQVVTTPAAAQAQAPRMQDGISLAPQADLALQSAVVSQLMVAATVARHRHRWSVASQNGEAPSGQAASEHSGSFMHVPP